MVRTMRRLERKMLFLAGTYLVTGLLVLGLGAHFEKKLLALFFVIGLFWLVSYCWEKGNYRGDPYLLPLVAVLSGTSLIFLYRLNPAYCWRQFFWLLAGIGALLATTLLFRNFLRLAQYKYSYALVGGVALLLPIFAGVEQGGVRSWLDLGFFYLQPSEFVKILLVLFLASYLSEYRQFLAYGARTFWGITFPTPREWVPLVAMWALSLVLLVFQKDLGTALIYFTTFLAMLYLATSRLGYVAIGFCLFLAGAAAAYHFFAHVQQRVEIWLNPWQYMETAGYQVVQSLYALGAGGLFGAGLGAGYPQLIPAVHTDFIFAAITEEMGLLGGVAIIFLYFLFLYRGFLIALRARYDFAVLLSAGLTALMGFQAVIIIAGVIKLLPLTGITLPFVSYGGSSLVANYIILGLLLNVSHETGGPAQGDEG